MGVFHDFFFVLFRFLGHNLVFLFINLSVDHNICEKVNSWVNFRFPRRIFSISIIVLRFVYGCEYCFHCFIEKFKISQLFVAFSFHIAWLHLLSD